MSEIAIISEEYEREIKECEILCSRLSSLMSEHDTEKSVLLQQISQCELKLKRVKRSKDKMGVAMAQLKDKTQKSEYNKIKKAHDASFDSLRKGVELAKERTNKSDLFSGASQNPMHDTEGKDNDQLLREADRIQDLTLASTARTKVMVEQTIELGIATIDELRRQHVQIHDIEEDVDVLDNHLERAERLITNFTRRMATDKLIQGFAAVNIFIMLSLIIYVAVTGKSLSAAAKKNPDFKMFFQGTPTVAPTFVHPAFKSDGPTGQPSRQPTRQPTRQPSCQPTLQPVFHPSSTPISFPSYQPSVIPTLQPTDMPTVQPTGYPSGQPTPQPTTQPIMQPTTQPSSQPTKRPSSQPTNRPSNQPSAQPSTMPSLLPTSKPSLRPTSQPTPKPSPSPSPYPTPGPSPYPTAPPTS